MKRHNQVIRPTPLPMVISTDNFEHFFEKTINNEIRKIIKFVFKIYIKL